MRWGWARLMAAQHITDRQLHRDSRDRIGGLLEFAFAPVPHCWLLRPSYQRRPL